VKRRLLQDPRAWGETISGWQSLCICARPRFGNDHGGFEPVVRRVQQLRIAAEFAWNIRWKIAWDMNGDGMVTISDVWLWLKWIFFAPGDLLLLLLMKYRTPSRCS
jgi:hypothetical protein